MMFHWQCDLAPMLSDSGSSRFVITTIPSSAYVFDGDINITLQCAAKHISTSLANLKLTVPYRGPEPVSWPFNVYEPFLFSK